MQHWRLCAGSEQIGGPGLTWDSGRPLRPLIGTPALTKSLNLEVTAPEATAFKYAMGLFSVLIGLAVADVATSFHRLMRVRQTVRWDPLALAAAFYALCITVYMWFDIWGVRHFGATRPFLLLSRTRGSALRVVPHRGGKLAR